MHAAFLQRNTALVPREGHHGCIKTKAACGASGRKDGDSQSCGTDPELACLAASTPDDSTSTCRVGAARFRTEDFSCAPDHAAGAEQRGDFVTRTSPVLASSSPAPACLCSSANSCWIGCRDFRSDENSAGTTRGCRKQERHLHLVQSSPVIWSPFLGPFRFFELPR